MESKQQQQQFLLEANFIFLSNHILYEFILGAKWGAPLRSLGFFQLAFPPPLIASPRINDDHGQDDNDFARWIGAV